MFVGASHFVSYFHVANFACFYFDVYNVTSVARVRACVCVRVWSKETTANYCKAVFRIYFFKALRRGPLYIIHFTSTFKFVVRVLYEIYFFSGGLFSFLVNKDAHIGSRLKSWCFTTVPILAAVKHQYSVCISLRCKLQTLSPITSISLPYTKSLPTYAQIQTKTVQIHKTNAQLYSPVNFWRTCCWMKTVWVEIDMYWQHYY